jgi:uncharacterized protein (UPF0335 family)
MTATARQKKAPAAPIRKPDGASAQSIWAHLCGGSPQDGDYPHDGDDFGRCQKFLDANPHLRADLPRMAEVNDYWGALVPRWDEIAASTDRYRLMKSILDPIAAGDPSVVRITKSAVMRIGPITHKASRPTPAPEFVKAADDMARKGRPPMAADPDFKKHNQDAYAVTADELRQFIEGWEQLQSEKNDIATQQKDLMGEAKGRGYDTKVMRKVIDMRKRKPDELAEEEAVLDLYKTALGMT